MDQAAKKLQFKGIVLKQRIIKAEAPTLAYIEFLRDDQEIIHAIIARNTLTFMLEVAAQDRLTIFGHFNARQQFVIEKYLIHSKADLNREQGNQLNYPKQRKPYNGGE